jgi:hypothetical protein
MPSETPQNPRGNGPYAYDEPDPNPQGGTLYPLKPAADRYQAPVFAYRGTQQHGVDPARSTDPPEYMAEGGTVAIKPPKKEPDPVAVRIVSSGTKEYSQWRSFQAYVSGSPAQVVNRKEDREELTLKNLSSGPGVTVWVGPDANVSKQSGYPITAGGTFTLSGEAEIWAVSDDASLVILAGFFTFSTKT